MKIFESFDEAETFAFGKKMGEQAKPGETYCLEGDLGVGKTVFTQGFAAGLGIEGPVSSPTFTIVQEYLDGRLPLYHFDVYRIADPDEMADIGYEEYFFPGTASAWWNGRDRSRSCCRRKPGGSGSKKTWIKDLIIAGLLGTE